MNKDPRIQLKDNAMDIMVKMGDGNPGATMALISIMEKTEVIDPDSALGGLGLILRFDDMGIYGTDIYVLWSDKCDKDVRKLCVLMRANQVGLISDQTVIGMAKDQMREINLSEALWADIDTKVCEMLPNFMKP